MSTSHRSERWIGLAEALVATVVLVTITVGVAPLLFYAGGAAASARDQTMTAVLAASKLHELQTLAWGYRTTPGGLLEPIEDTSTNLAVLPPDASGRGLTPAPERALIENTWGYVDFLDQWGRWVGTGTFPPPAARYVRRWSVRPWVRDVDDSLVLQVVAATVKVDLVGGPRTDTRSRRADTWVFSLKTRVRP